MATYSNFSIGGVPCLVDPDQVSENVQNLVHITRAMQGNSYVTSYGAGNGFTKTVNISGALLGSAAALNLVNLAKQKMPITVSMVDGIFIVMSASRNPEKPRTPWIDGSGLDGDVLYSYNISLQEVS